MYCNIFYPEYTVYGDVTLHSTYYKRTIVLYNILY